MKKFILIIVNLFFLNTAKSQDLFIKRKATVESFVTALFLKDKSHRFIIENYIYVPLNDSIPLEKRGPILGTLIDTLKKSHSAAVSSFGYRVFSYDDFKGEKKIFSDPTQDIAILTVHDKPVIYFYFYGDKIYSFTLMEKGKYSYFIII